MVEIIIYVTVLVLSLKKMRRKCKCDWLHFSTLIQITGVHIQPSSQASCPTV